MEARALLFYTAEAASACVKLSLHPSIRVSIAPIAAGIVSQVVRRATDIVFLIATPAGEREALGLLAEVRQCSDTPVVLALRQFDAEHAVNAFRAGAADVIEWDASTDEISQAIVRAGVGHCSSSSASSDGPTLVGNSPAITAVIRYVNQVATSDGTVLITGETGTGKEVTAEMIHARSHRKSGPLIAVNCAAIPETLLESELFGHLKGAFTGANRSRAGAFAAAEGGSIFLDEIGELNATVQAKLLRVLENHTVRPLGSDREVPVNVRVIAATNQDPERLLRERRFREDLYFRLDVARIYLPPLRTRRGDIPLLVDHLMTRCASRQRVSLTRVDHRLMDRLMRYDWPGNVRELRNFLETALAGQSGANLRMEDLPLHWRDRLRTVTNRGDMERSRVLDALVSSNWNKTEAARLLSCSRMTLYRKMSRHRIVPAGAA